MKVNRITDVKPYEAAGHFNMEGFRLQGFDASDCKNFWVGISHFNPGGGVEHGATPLEKVYICIDGVITIITDDGEETLNPLDSCYIPGGEARSIANRSDKVASILVVMPYPPQQE